MSLSSCPETNLGQWGQALVERLGGERYPLSGTFEITERCNLACVHCYINQPVGAQAAATQELGLSATLSLLDQIAELGTLDLLLSGGEPLLRPDFVEVYQHARRLGIVLTVFTNGTLLTPAIVDVLAEYGVFQIEITAYGASQETYEGVTGVPGSYARYMRGVELALDRGLPLALKTVVMTANGDELERMRGLAAGLGVPFRYDAMLWPRLDGGMDPWKYRLTPDEIVALDETPERTSRWLAYVARLDGEQTRGEHIYSCGAGQYTFHISAAGRLSACMMAREPSYDVRNTPLRHAWDALGDVRTQLRQQPSECTTCEAGAFCLQCPGWSQTVHQDSETLVQYVCEVGRLRAAAFVPLNKQ